MPGQKEHTDVLGIYMHISESESLLDGEDDRFRKKSVKTCNLLKDIFGSDATTKIPIDTFIAGISLVNSQISVLR